MRRGFEEGEEGKDRWNRQGKRVVEGCDERGGEGLDTDTLLYCCAAVAVTLQTREDALTEIGKLLLVIVGGL